MNFKKLFFVAFVLGCIQFNYSQNTGIAIQGIARDANNTARTNQDITLKFEVYHVSNNASEIVIYTENITVKTDAFGVFSHNIDSGIANNPQYSQFQMYLRISEGTTIISNEKFKQVPYAITASNGVPTGSIMPFIGTVAPKGWLFCDGRAISTSDPSTAALRTLLGGTHTPNLHGMFLRGTGTSPVNNRPGPALKGTQGDEFRSHAHAHGSLTTTATGNHNHDNGAYNRILRISASNSNNVTPNGFDNGNRGSELNVKNGAAMSTTGNHSHTITGNTASSGSAETRPVSYGVNYIIKL